MAEDVYQERYLAHQQRKAKILAEIVAERHSERQFGRGEVDETPILEAISDCANSCNRQAVYPKVITERDDKSILGGLLVGGVGWIHRADKIILLFADPIAYKAGDEINYMPYLDAGVQVGQAYLAASANDIAICYANPNVREKHKEFFQEMFGDDLFCGALAIGRHRDT